jgi:hypothetical protein
MAVRSATYPTKPQTTDFDGIIIIEWTGLLNGDTGEAVRLPAYSDRAVQVAGTFGAGGNARILGSLFDTATNMVVLTDPQGNALDITTAKIEQVMEMSGWIQPSITAGDGTTSLTVRLIAKKG